MHIHSYPHSCVSTFIHIHSHSYPRSFISTFIHIHVHSYAAPSGPLPPSAHSDLFAMCLFPCARFPSVAAASPAPLTSASPPPPRQCPHCSLDPARFTCVCRFLSACCCHPACSCLCLVRRFACCSVCVSLPLCVCTAIWAPPFISAHPGPPSPPPRPGPAHACLHFGNTSFSGASKYHTHHSKNPGRASLHGALDVGDQTLEALA